MIHIMRKQIIQTLMTESEDSSDDDSHLIDL